MKISNSKLTFLKFLVIPCLLFTVFLTACSKDDDNSTENNSYPKDVNVEYRATSVSGTTVGDIIYLNETGGNAILDDVSLPFSKSFKRNVKQYEALSINFTSLTGGEVKLEILVDGKVVKTQNYSGTSVVTGSLVYLFE